MSRRIARELALQSLFQIDFSEVSSAEALSVALAEFEKEKPLKSQNYATKVLEGTLANLALIDNKINQYAVDWNVERMPAVDRNILRIAVYELFFSEEKLAPTVAINEAVEIARIYGTDDSPRFINGVLGKMVREDGEE